jgi:hypothetical protein
VAASAVFGVVDSQGLTYFILPFVKRPPVRGARRSASGRPASADSNADRNSIMFRTRRFASSMYFSDSNGNKVEPEHYGIEDEAIDGAFDLVTLKTLAMARRN